MDGRDGDGDRRRPSLFARAWWWASDYVYAGRRQLAILAPPWTFFRSRPAPASWDEGAEGRPELVLIPGVYEHWTFLRPLGDALSTAGYRVRVVPGLGINRRGVPDTSADLGRYLARHPVPPAGRILVAHSKGGLIGKHLLVSAAVASAGDDGLPAADLLGLVTICTPFQGSWLARMFFVPSIRAFRPHDRTIMMLRSDESVNARIVSIFGRYDPHIPEGSELAGATNVEVDAVGHFRILASPATHRAVIDGVRGLTL